MQPTQVPSLSSRSLTRRPALNENGVDAAAIDHESRVRNELHLLATKVEQLSTANRRKDEFLAALSHELRSPLASIQHGIGVLRGQKSDDETVRLGMYELIDRQLRQIALLASGLFDVGRITSGQLLVRRERTDLHAVVAKEAEPALGSQLRHFLCALSYVCLRTGYALLMIYRKEALW